MSYGDRVSLATPHFYQNSSLIIGHERKTTCMVPQNQHKPLRDTSIIKYYMNRAGRADEQRMAGREKLQVK